MIIHMNGLGKWSGNLVQDWLKEWNIAVINGDSSFPGTWAYESEDALDDILLNCEIVFRTMGRSWEKVYFFGSIDLETQYIKSKSYMKKSPQAILNKLPFIKNEKSLVVLFQNTAFGMQDIEKIIQKIIRNNSMNFPYLIPLGHFDILVASSLQKLTK